MRVLSGPLMMSIGVLDLLYVLVFHSRQLTAIAWDGFLDAVEIGPAHLDREVAFPPLAVLMLLTTRHDRQETRNDNEKTGRPLTGENR